MKWKKFTYIFNIVTICLPLLFLKSQENHDLTTKEKLELFGNRLHPHSYHYPERHKKNLIQLNDSSIWYILEEDRHVIKDWKKSHELFIKPAYSCFWPEFLMTYNYVLQNLTENAVVAVYLNQIENHALSIETIDIVTHSILLNDKTVWKIDEQSNISDWKIEQRILVGVNNRWYVTEYPQILINGDLIGYPYVCATFLRNQEF